MPPPPSAPPREIIFFGGSFDPPHCGHLAIAEAAQQALSCEPQVPSTAVPASQAIVLFAPVGRQPLKPAGSSASFEHRVAMTRLAIAHHPGFEVTLADAPNSAHGKPNYTIDTLLTLRTQYPLGTRWHLLLGADSFRTFHHWHRAAEIPFTASLIVASRPGEDLTNLPSLLPPTLTLTPTASHHFILRNPAGQQASLLVLPSLHYDISATHLRDQINDLSGNPQHLLPQAVLDYIHQHHLYR
jgi:nicotinate-nucleotide adenylyltransferase